MIKKYLLDFVDHFFYIDLTYLVRCGIEGPLAILSKGLQ